MLLVVLRAHCRNIPTSCRVLSKIPSATVFRKPFIDSCFFGYLTLCKDLVFVDKFEIRWIRSRSNDKDSGLHSDGKDTRSTEHSGDASNTGGQDPEKPKVDPALLRKLRIYVLIVGGISFVMSFLILSQMASGQAQMEGLQPEFLTRPGIDMKIFLEKYLRAGEVRRIIFCPDYSRAVALLHDGAIIDGKKVHEPVVVVEYSKDAKQFWGEVRDEEESMGISVSNGVQLDMYRGMTTFRVIELMIGVLIIAWLGTQYGRLLRNRMLANKQKKNGDNSK